STVAPRMNVRMDPLNEDVRTREPPNDSAQAARRRSARQARRRKVPLSRPDGRPLTEWGARGNVYSAYLITSCMETRHGARACGGAQPRRRGVAAGAAHRHPLDPAQARGDGRA